MEFDIISFHFNFYLNKQVVHDDWMENKWCHLYFIDYSSIQLIQRLWLWYKVLQNSPHTQMTKDEFLNCTINNLLLIDTTSVLEA